MLIQVKHTQCVHIFFVRQNPHKTSVFWQNNHMKRISSIIIPILLFWIVLLFSFAVIPIAKGVVYAESGIYQKLNDELIALYETDIAGEKVVSDMPEKDLDALASKHGFSKKKTKALVILSDLSFRVGEGTPFCNLAKMSDMKIIKLARHLFDLYGKTLTQEQKDSLKEKALSAIKSN